MNWKSIWKVTAVTSVMVGATLAGSPANAEDFFSSLFGGLLRDAPRQVRAPTLPFADPNANGATSTSPRVAVGGSVAYCVRTCDGRYFPLSGTGGQSKAEACSSLCPASETKIVYGSSIDNAATDTGKPYSALPNAFRYRTELVNGCTCNGKTSGGLAHVNVQDDPTLRKGDLVASTDGSLVTSRGGGDVRRAASFTPAQKSRRQQMIQIPIVAEE
ncbi:MAG: DUF2865 domain-containing protein [Xanthobacteraceae bacterium]|nr:DUF2865 domain-containing protein [Xanthobacteraceae bacterium]